MSAALENFLTMLDSVQPRGSRWAAKCPAHEDKSPSLSVSEGERGVLLKCWAGCSVQEICEKLGIQQKDLFFATLDTNPQRRRAAAQERDHRQRERERQANQEGATIDLLKAAEAHIQSRRGLDISTWTDGLLDEELSALADAYSVLESESHYE